MMRSKRWSFSVACGVASLLALLTGTAFAEIQSRQFKVVGTWNNQSPFLAGEQPFWTKTLPQASGGKLTGQINSIVELGLKGWEVMRLTKLGVFDVAHGVYGYVASEEPALEGIDLGGVAKDFAQGRQIAKAYSAIVAKRFDEAFNAKHLMTYPFPSQMVFCSKPFEKLTDLKNKRVRVYSTTLGDFVEGLGGTSVTLTYAEVVPALQKGVADCAITGTMPAYQGKWHEVITHLLKIRVNMGLAFMAMSNKTWNKLNADTQALLLDQIGQLEDRMWAYSAAEDEEAFRCLSGSGDCPLGKPGNVIITEPTAADFAVRDKLLRDTVLKRWAARCSAECVAEWNATVAPIVGVKAEK
jgi:TRAP-type C4-dicarboxylate transport system substrate-binding protein